MYVSRVLDRQLLNGWCHCHENYRLWSRPHSHESVIFSSFWDSYFLSYGEFVEFIMKLRVQTLRGARQRRAWSLAIGQSGVITLLGVTAGKASHNASNARGVAAGKMGCNSSVYNITYCKRVLTFIKLTVYDADVCCLPYVSQWLYQWRFWYSSYRFLTIVTYVTTY